MNEESLKEYATIVRESIRHENELTNHRLTWLLILQGILFAGASSFWNIHKIPFIIIAFLGVSTSASAFYALWLSKMGRRQLRSQFKKKLDEHPELTDSIPPITGDSPETINLPWANPGMFIPWAFIVSWILLIICHLVNKTSGWNLR